MLKKTLFIIGIILCLTQIPALSENDTTINNPNNTVVEQDLDEITDYAEEQSITTTPRAGEIDSKIVKSPYENDFQEEIPKQNEFTKAVFMFLKTMLAVVVCSIIIFVLLIGIRKFYGLPNVEIQDDKKIEDNLKSTQNENEALQTFFNKTKNL